MEAVAEALGVWEVAAGVLAATEVTGAVEGATEAAVAVSEVTAVEAGYSVGVPSDAGLTAQAEDITTVRGATVPAVVHSDPAVATVMGLTDPAVDTVMDRLVQVVHREASFFTTPRLSFALMVLPTLPH